MEIFGLPLQDFIFTIFLPFIFFYLLIYALLRKTKILGEDTQTSRLNSLISITISALSVFSLYSLGLTASLPALGGIIAVTAFVSLVIYGIFAYAFKKQVSYSTGEAFKTEDERKFDSLVKDCENMWKKFKAEKNEESLKDMAQKINELGPLAKKLGKSLYDYEWYSGFMQIARASGG
jgi:hypothetical protein